MTDHPRIERLDPARVVAQIAAAGGPSLAVVGPMAGGEVGAWLVRRPDGRDAVLTWRASPPSGGRDGSHDEALRVMRAAADAGVPLPRYESVHSIDGGIAVVQERAR